MYRYALNLSFTKTPKIIAPSSRSSSISFFSSGENASESSSPAIISASKAFISSISSNPSFLIEKGSNVFTPSTLLFMYPSSSHTFFIESTPHDLLFSMIRFAKSFAASLIPGHFTTVPGSFAIAIKAKFGGSCMFLLTLKLPIN